MATRRSNDNFIYLVLLFPVLLFVGFVYAALSSNTSKDTYTVSAEATSTAAYRKDYGEAFQYMKKTFVVPVAPKFPKDLNSVKSSDLSGLSASDVRLFAANGAANKLYEAGFKLDVGNSNAEYVWSACAIGTFASQAKPAMRGDDGNVTDRLYRDSLVPLYGIPKASETRSAMHLSFSAGYTNGPAGCSKYWQP